MTIQRWQQHCNQCMTSLIKSWLPHKHLHQLAAEAAFRQDVKMLRSPSDPRSIPYHSPIPFWPLSDTSDTILPFSETSNQSLRPPTTFQFLLFHFSSLALCFCFHIPASVSSFLYPIYCTISVFLLSLSNLLLVYWKLTSGSESDVGDTKSETE